MTSTNGFLSRLQVKASLAARLGEQEIDWLQEQIAPELDRLYKEVASLKSQLVQERQRSGSEIGKLKEEIKILQSNKLGCTNTSQVYSRYGFNKRVLLDYGIPLECVEQD